MSFAGSPPASPAQSEQPFSENDKSSVKVKHNFFIVWELVLLLFLTALGLVVHIVKGPLPGELTSTLAFQHLVLPFGWLVFVFDEVSALNWPNQALIGVVGITIGLLLLRRWLDAIVTVLSSIMSDASSFLANQLVQRPRPVADGLYVKQVINTYYSFPSGHVVHVIAFFGFLLFLTFQTHNRHNWLWIVRIPLIIILVFVAPSRVLEGEHWPTDVLGGLLLGAFWLVIGTHLYHWVGKKWPPVLGKAQIKEIG